MGRVAEQHQATVDPAVADHPMCLVDQQCVETVEAVEEAGGRGERHAPSLGEGDRVPRGQRLPDIRRVRRAVEVVPLAAYRCAAEDAEPCPVRTGEYGGCIRIVGVDGYQTAYVPPSGATRVRAERPTRPYSGADAVGPHHQVGPRDRRSALVGDDDSPLCRCTCHHCRPQARARLLRDCSL